MVFPSSFKECKILKSSSTSWGVNTPVGSSKISISGLENFAENSVVTCELKHYDGKSEKISLRHSYNSLQIKWFKAGSALNVLKNRKM